MAPREIDPASYTPAPLPVAALDEAGRLACLRLIRSENVGPVTFRELINHFGGATRALEALPDLARRTRRGRPIRICPEADAAAELEAASRHGASPLFTIEPGYPRALAHIEMPPPLVYAKGRLDLLKRDGLAIVGARNASAAGREMTRRIASRVGEAGYAIVSGLALGIDAAAHEASLATGTIAVIAGGIDFVYPPENAALQASIGETGCLVTEQAPGFRPRGQDFPRRNRIISGLALAVLVVEAARRSGSLITAHAANDQGRAVMAVPGHPLDPRSEGPNALLKRPGVTMVTDPSDILEALEPMRARAAHGDGRNAFTEAPPELHGARAWPAEAESRREPPREVGPPLAPADQSVVAEAVLGALGPAPVTLDQLARHSGFPVQAVRAALLELTLQGYIEQHGSQLVSLRSR